MCKIKIYIVLQEHYIGEIALSMLDFRDISSKVLLSSPAFGTPLRHPDLLKICHYLPKRPDGIISAIYCRLYCVLMIAIYCRWYCVLMVAIYCRWYCVLCDDCYLLQMILCIDGCYVLKMVLCIDDCYLLQMV